MALLLKNAHVIDPQVGLNETADILVRDGKIVEIGQNLAMEKGVERDLGGKIVVPGLVDIHVHLREPGYELKEDIASGTRAAAHGGFTAVCCMPNTKPVIDNAVGVEYVKARAAAVGKCRVHVAGSVVEAGRNTTSPRPPYRCGLAVQLVPAASTNSTRRARMSRMVQICRWAGGGRLRCMALPPCFVLLPHGMHRGRRLCAGRKCGTL